MKSAYELAMERLKADDTEVRQELTDQQKAQIGEIEAIYRAKIAERDVFLKKQLEEVRAQQNFDEENAILKQIASERLMLEEEMEEKKRAVRGH